MHFAFKDKKRKNLDRVLFQDFDCTDRTMLISVRKGRKRINQKFPYTF